MSKRKNNKIVILIVFLAIFLLLVNNKFDEEPKRQASIGEWQKIDSNDNGCVDQFEIVNYVQNNQGISNQEIANLYFGNEC